MALVHLVLVNLGHISKVDRKLESYNILNRITNFSEKTNYTRKNRKDFITNSSMEVNSYK